MTATIHHLPPRTTNWPPIYGYAGVLAVSLLLWVGIAGVIALLL